MQETIKMDRFPRRAWGNGKGLGNQNGTTRSAALTLHPWVTPTQIEAALDDLAQSLNATPEELRTYGMVALWDINTSSLRMGEQAREADEVINKHVVAALKEHYRNNRTYSHHLTTFSLGTIETETGTRAPFSSILLCPGSPKISPSHQELVTKKRDGQEAEKIQATLRLEGRQTAAWLWLNVITKPTTSFTLLDPTLLADVERYLARTQPPNDGRSTYDMVGLAKDDGGINPFDVLTRLREETTYVAGSSMASNALVTRLRFHPRKPLIDSQLARWFEDIVMYGAQWVQAAGYPTFTAESYLRVEKKFLLRAQEFVDTSPEYSEDEEEREMGGDGDGINEGPRIEVIDVSNGEAIVASPAEEEQKEGTSNGGGREEAQSGESSANSGQLPQMNSIQQYENQIGELQVQTRALTKQVSRLQDKLEKARVLLTQSGKLVKEWSHVAALHVFDVAQAQMGRDERKTIGKFVADHLGFDIRTASGISMISWETLEEILHQLQNLNSAEKPVMPGNEEQDAIWRTIPRPPNAGQARAQRPATSPSKEEATASPKKANKGTFPKKSTSKGDAKKPTPAGPQKQQGAPTEANGDAQARRKLAVEKLKKLNRDQVTKLKGFRTSKVEPCEICRDFDTSIGWEDRGGSTTHAGTHCKVFAKELHEHYAIPWPEKKESQDAKRRASGPPQGQKKSKKEKK